MWPMIVVMALIVVIGVPVTLWWWKQADKWAGQEHADRSTPPAPSQKRPPTAKL
jgi:hypothetical protein